jgi:hypothetical protein
MVFKNKLVINGNYEEEENLFGKVSLWKIPRDQNWKKQQDNG